MKTIMYLGTHQSIEDGFKVSVEKAIELGTNCVQIFVRNPQNLSSKIPPIDLEAILEVRKILKKHKMKLFVHANYLYNFCTSPSKYDWGRQFLKDELKMANLLGAEGIVLHMGAHVKESLSVGFSNFVQNLKMILEEVPEGRILLETPHGKGTKIAGSIEELGNLINTFKTPRVGLCVDTAHIFYYGYMIDNIEGLTQYFKDVASIVGIRKLGLIHLNDAMLPFGSKIDRHGTVGEGNIFKHHPNLIRFMKELSVKYHIPMIMESRTDAPAPEYKYKQELNYIRGASRKDVKETILEILKKLEQYHKAIGKYYEASAYEKAYNTIRRYKNEITSGKSVEHLEGIGEGISRKIDEIITTGKLKLLIEMENDPVYKSLIELQTVDGIGPVLAKELVEKGIRNIEELRKMHSEGKIKLNHQQQVGLKYYKDLHSPIPRAEIEKYKDMFEDVFEKGSIELAGSYRTGSEYSSDIDMILVDYDDIESVIDNIAEIVKVVDVVNKGKNGAYLLVKLPLLGSKVRHLDIRLVDKENVHSYLLYFGSGTVFSKWIRSIAKEKGYKLNEMGLYELKNGYHIKTKTEKEIFKVLGITWVEPEDRV
jgi:apurinic endonuclease APN1